MKKKKKKGIYDRLSKIFIVLSILGIFAWAGIFAVNRYIGEEVEYDEEGNVIPIVKKDVLSVLLCGENEGMTDTMIYVKYNVKTGYIAMMSIPRDTYINENYTTIHKLNAIYTICGVETLTNQVEKMLGVEIDYYAVVSNDTVVNVIDVLGGVEFDVPIRMKYTDKTQNLYIDLQPGVQLLDGSKVEQLLRFRKGDYGFPDYPRADLQRQETQQEFIKEFIKTVLKPTNITKLPNVIKAGLDGITTNMRVREALKYTTDFKNVKFDNIYSCTTEGTTPYIDGISYFKIDEYSTHEIIKEHFDVLDNMDYTPPVQDMVE